MVKITLKAARVNVGLSQKEAAQKIGVSNRTLCNWETGSSYPPANKIADICALYGICYDNLNFSPNCSLLANIGDGKEGSQ